MYVIVAAAIAAVLSWWGNKIITLLWKAQGIVFVTPLLEETTKTGAAYLLGQHIVLVHGAFGIIEACVDLILSKKAGIMAALASIFGHLFYGVITIIGIQHWSLLVGVFMAYLIHFLWNAFVIKWLAGPKALP